MPDYNKLIKDIILDRSVPEFVHRDYPTFIAFLKAYFEHLEQSKNPLDITKYLSDYRDIDQTLDEFVEFFRKEYLLYIPESVLADKRLLVKHIKSFYANKGNEESYRFLFRILYGEDIDFYYPKVDILRASDGKWTENKTLKITFTDEDLFTNLINNRITGLTSGATAIVEDVVRYTERGETVVELTLSDIRGDFQENEDIEVTYIDSDDQEYTSTETILSVYNEINVSNAGSGYTVGNIIPIRNLGGDIISTAEILKVTSGAITGLTIDEPGTGYNGEINEVDTFGNLPFDYIWNGKAVGEYALDEMYDSNLTIGDLTFDFVIPTEMVPGEGDIITISDSLGGTGSGAFGVVDLVGPDGEILDVSLVDVGTNYNAPSATVVSDTGTGAEISVVGGAGAIDRVRMISFPVTLESDFDSNGTTAYPDFTNHGDGNAVGTLETGALCEYPGLWVNEDGHLSSSKKLQDNFYYQDYSYVIKVGQALNIWRDIVKKIIHPAGLALFGEYSAQIEIDVGITYVDQSEYISIVCDQSENITELEDSVVKLYTIDSNDNLTPILDSNGNHLVDF